MPFPAADRVIYTRNPLTEVIAQLRFPPILKIDQDAPAIFQDRIRARFPFYETRVEENFLPAEVRRLMPPEIVEMFTAETRNKVHDFITEDGNWRLSLAKNFVALSTLQYTRWQEFRDLLAEPLVALHQEYAPSFYTRIGLRYRNVIRRSSIGLTDVPWAALLQPYIAGALSTSLPGEESIVNSAHRIEIKLAAEGGLVRVMHGFLEVDGEVGYSIDNDLFTEQRTEVDDAVDKLDYFNGRAGRVFRWCISDRLHVALEPTVP